MAAIATFNFGLWVQRYPQFAQVSPELAQAYFDEATLYWANDGCSGSNKPTAQLTYLNMLTAHIATLNTPDSSGSVPGIVGRISSAAEGTVSVGAQNDYPPGTPQWYQQTRPGSDFWAATAAYRTARWRAPFNRRVFAPWPYQ